MENNEIFNGLSKFGLSSYEIKIYETLVLQGKPMTSTEVVKITGIPQPRIYDLFSNMVRKGFIEESIDKHKKYRAVPVSAVFKREKDWIESYSINLERYVENRKIYENVSSNFLSLFEGEQDILNKTLSMIESTNKELLISISGDEYDLLKDSLTCAYTRGVTVVLLIFNKDKIDFDGDILLRYLEGKPTELVISDRKSALINITGKSKNKKNSLYFEEDNFIHVISYYFNQSLWQNSKIIKNFAVKNNNKFCNIWLTCDFIDFFLSLGFSINGEIRGYYHDDLRTLTGKIIKTERLPFVRNTFYIETDKKIYSVGGKTSNLEDIKMLYGNFNLLQD